jgi:hypothetical protein
VSNFNPFEKLNSVDENVESQNPFFEDEPNNVFSADNPFPKLEFPFPGIFNTTPKASSGINVVVKVSLVPATELELEANGKTMLTIALRSELQLLGSMIHNLDITDTSIEFTVKLSPNLTVEKLIRSSETKLQTVWLMEKKQSLLFQTANAESVAAIH